MGTLLDSLAFGQAGRNDASRTAGVLSALHGTGERPEELLHDARNMVTALELYCDLLEERGVLPPAFAHYASELRLVTAASRRLVEKLAAFGFDCLQRDGGPRAGGATAGQDRHSAAPAEAGLQEPILSLADELRAKHNLMAALAGTGIKLELRIHGGSLPVYVSREDLTRILVNLVKNAVEAMPSGGSLWLSLDEFHAPGERCWIVLKLEDSGPGIPPEALEAVFLAGYTTKCRTGTEGGQRRGLGLSITRGIVEAAGGRILAANRPQGGAQLEIELPARRR